MKMSKLKFSIFLLLCFWVFEGHSQILDDSTKLVYGPSTLHYLLLDEVKDNVFKKNILDTTLYDNENFTTWDKGHKKSQYLGANGTASRPFYYQSPEVIGLRSGFNVYDVYVRKKTDFRFFNSKSPFIDLNAGFGGGARSTVEFDFSRNIRPNINFSFGLRRFTTDKQIGPAATSGDRNTVGSNLDATGNYRSKDGKYLALFYINRFNNMVSETGGVDITEGGTIAELFAFEDAPIRLRNVEAVELRNNIHLYHEYRLGTALQLYHELDYSKQRITYFDELGDNADSESYANFLLSNTTTDDAFSFRAFQNELGIKGDIAKGFYKAFLRRRDALATFRFLDKQNAGEVYVGGSLRYDLNEKNSIDGKAEFLQTGDLLVSGSIKNKFFNASYTTKRYQPSIQQTRFFGNHFFWQNNFESTFSNELKGNLNFDFDWIKVKPKVALSTLSNFVFFNTEGLPEQADENLVISTYGLDFGIKKVTSKKNNEFLAFDSEVLFTALGGGDADKYRVPQLVYYGKLYWEGFLFNNSLQVQLGTDIFFRSAYFAYDYSFGSQQFFLTDENVEENELDSYLLADLFLNFKVDKVRVFFKWNHFNQANDDGYQVTPLYPGQQKVIDFGVKWLFFD